MDWWNLRCKAVLKPVCSHVGATFYTKENSKEGGRANDRTTFFGPPGRHDPVATTSRENYRLNVYRAPNNCHIENVCDRNSVAPLMHFKV